MYPYPPQDEVRTLFISGLPVDVKEREIHNLLRLIPGYESCTLSLIPDKPPVAFATFINRTSAISGQSYLQGIKFDPDFPQTLRIEFAKANSKKRLLADVDNPPRSFTDSSALFDGERLRLRKRSEGIVFSDFSSPGQTPFYSYPHQYSGYHAVCKSWLECN
eukprot:TRINITY_DN4026_c0_g2_i1.p1 TRINITY_DN4026_c0_g2~~TRINITY_DN4026_c0_g2_i1.p1  ORF type:complete len:182 (-),score=21.50 TRINITY_DN4026_c0_g2_i1:447-932(-)